MRKTLEIIALVLTIVASLVAIIAFFSGHSSVEGLFSSAPSPTPVTSASPGPTSLPPLSEPSSPLDFSFAGRIWFWWIFLSIIIGICVLMLSVKEGNEYTRTISVAVGAAIVCFIVVLLIDLLIRLVFQNSLAGDVVSMIILILATILMIICTVIIVMDG